MNLAQPLLKQPTDFADLVLGFCTWCEGDGLGPAPEAAVARWLACLYSAALSLPASGPESEKDLPDLPVAQLARAEANLAMFYGWYYREHFDPDPALDDEPCVGDVGDDLMDIYKDLKSGLLAFNSGDAPAALWHWSYLHKVHWGRHAVGALFALHCMHLSK